MTKKICFYIFLFFVFILNIIVDFNIKNYVDILNICFNKNIILTNKLFAFICLIIALISILLVIDIILVLFKKNNENKGIKFKAEDGTHGTADWMSKQEIPQILGINNIPGIILGRYYNDIVKLPFDSYFNKNICIFGSSGSMKTIRIFINKLVRTITIYEIYYSY